MTKKSQVASASVELEASRPKIYVCTPAMAPEHKQYLERVEGAIGEACRGYPIQKGATQSDADGWQAVVEAYNREAETFLKSDCEYMFLVESDTVVPEHALAHMLNLEADVVGAFQPYHYDAELMDPSWKVWEGILVGGYFKSEKEWGMREYLRKEDVDGKILEGNVYSGTGCLLIHRRVFEGGIRFYRPGLEGAGFDLQFWKDIQKQGFRGVLDGFVICEHLGL